MKTYSICTIDGTWHTVEARKFLVDNGVVLFYAVLGEVVALFPIESIMALLVRETETDKSDT
jgi:hypothetical protein